MSPASEPRTWFEHTGNRHVYKINVPDTYVIAAEVKAIGGDPLMLHKVRILDAATGEQVGDVLTTDEQGVVRAVVPRNAEYRIEIVDEEIEWEPAPVPDEIEHALLRCEFTDETGAPLADREGIVRDHDSEYPVVLDDDGRFEMPVPLGPYQITVDGHEFDAYALPRADGESEERLYRFVVDSKAGDQEESEATDADERLIAHDLPPADDEEYA